MERGTERGLNNVESLEWAFNGWHSERRMETESKRSIRANHSEWKLRARSK